MLKKAGIIVGGIAALLVAASPLAFADDTSRSPECDFVAAADNSVEQEGTGGSTTLGAVAGAVANTAAVANAQTQAPVASCNNIEDVLSTETTDNSEDNDVTRESIEDSFNVED
jgi:hypothetical protein